MIRRQILRPPLIHNTTIRYISRPLIRSGTSSTQHIHIRPLLIRDIIKFYTKMIVFQGGACSSRFAAAAAASGAEYGWLLMPHGWIV